MIVDATLFSGEREILEFRQRLLWNEVDLFVVLEGDKTFQGAPRARLLTSDAARKICAHQVTLQATDPWARERELRNAAKEACAFMAEDDLIILSDVDEIPSREAVERARAWMRNNPDALPRVGRMFPFYYSPRWLWPT